MHEKVGDRWEVAVSVTDGHFQQVSFVNGISTTKGGTHVKYISDQITENLLAHILVRDIPHSCATSALILMYLPQKKNKKLNLKAHHVKNYIWVFVNCLVENPTFDSQTKETMTKTKSGFGSTCELSEKFFKKGTPVACNFVF